MIASISQLTWQSFSLETSDNYPDVITSSLASDAPPHRNFTWFNEPKTKKILVFFSSIFGALISKKKIGLTLGTPIGESSNLHKPWVRVLR